MKNRDAMLERLRQYVPSDLPEHPRFPADLDIFDMPDGLGVQLRGGPGTVIVRGESASVLVPWLQRTLDGERTLGEVLEACPPDVSADELCLVIAHFILKGVIIDAARGTAKSGVGERKSDTAHELVQERQLLFWDRKTGGNGVNSNSHEVKEKLRETRVLLIANGLFGAATRDVLQLSGFENVLTIDFDEDPVNDLAASRERIAVGRDPNKFFKAIEDQIPCSDIVITALRNFPQALSYVINRSTLLNGVRWLRGEETATGTEIGPFIEPNDSPCYTCMALRKRSAEEYPIEEQLYNDHLSDDGNSRYPRLRGESIGHATASAGMLVEEAIRAATIINTPLTHGSVLTLWYDGSVSHEPFVRIPRCPDCYRGTSNEVISKKSVGTATRS